MGFFSNIGADTVIKEYKKAIKKLNTSLKRHPENLVDVGNDKLIFVHSRKRDPAVFPFEGVTTYDVICKGIMDFLTRYNPGNEYSYKKLTYETSYWLNFFNDRDAVVNMDKNKEYPPKVLVLRFKSAISEKFYVIDGIFNFLDPDSIRKAITLYYTNTKK